VHGPFATQPAQQKARPTWKTGAPEIVISQVVQVNDGLRERGRIGDLGLAGRPLDSSDAPRVAANCYADERMAHACTHRGSRVNVT